MRPFWCPRRWLAARLRLCGLGTLFRSLVVRTGREAVREGGCRGRGAIGKREGEAAVQVARRTDTRSNQVLEGRRRLSWILKCRRRGFSIRLCNRTRKDTCVFQTCIQSTTRCSEILMGDLLCFFMEVQEQAVQTDMHDSLILSTIALCFSTRGGVENRLLEGV